MKKLVIDYNKIANLFVFPQKKDYVDKVKDVQQYLNKILPEVGKMLQPFTDVISTVSTC